MTGGRRMARMASIGLAITAAWLLLAEPAVASDCQEPWDCFGSSAAGLAAVLGFLSFALNFVPIVGDAKGIIEAIVGRDILTGQRLSASDRMLSAVTAIPFLDVLRLFRGADGLAGLRAIDDMGVPRAEVPVVRPDVTPPRVEPPPMRPDVDRPSSDFTAGTLEHRDARWREYQERGGQWSRERWDRQYDINMQQARTANEAVTQFREELGLPREMQEVTVSVGDTTRRLDIADLDNAVGYEIKSGEYTTLDVEIRSELDRDAILVDQGWDITWVFHGRASQPLIDALTEADIKIQYVAGGG
jgi:hypothetical protein